MPAALQRVEAVEAGGMIGPPWIAEIKRIVDECVCAHGRRCR
jgi:hypothetical protein